jgi:DNA-binding IclR family transcriptional regulator
MLADEMDVVSAALFPEGDEVVVRERAASLTHLGWVLPAGQRYPKIPWGSFMLMPLSDAEVDESLDRQVPSMPADSRRDLHAQLAFARRHGFIVGVSPDGETPTQEGGRSWRPQGRFLSEVDPDQVYRIMFLVAPVLNDRGRVEFGIALYGFTRTMSGAEIVGVGHRLREACRRITTFIAGKRATAEF